MVNLAHSLFLKLFGRRFSLSNLILTNFSRFLIKGRREIGCQFLTKTEPIFALRYYFIECKYF